MKKSLIACLGDISNDPRPLRLLKYLSATYCVDLLSEYNDNNITSYYNKHYTLIHPSSQFEKIKRKLYKFLSFLPLPSPIRYYYLNCSLALNKLGLDFNKYDIIFVEDINLLPLISTKSSKVVIDLREYYPLQFENDIKFLLTRKPLATWICSKYLKRVQSSYTVSKGLAEKYRLEFGINPTLFMSTPHYYKISPKLTNNKKIKIVHHGVANSNRKIEKMIELLMILDSRFSLDMYLTGDSPYLSYLQEIVKGNDRVNIQKPVTFEKIIPTISNYDIGLFYIEPATFNLKNCLPNKLFEFIQARLAVAISPIKDMKNIVQQYNCGLASDSFNIENMAHKINSLTVDEIDEYKQNRDKAAHILCFENESKKIHNTIIRQ